MTETEEKVTEFIKLLQNERPLLEDGLKFLTLTQQHEYKYIGGVDVKSMINGLYSLIQQTKSFTVKEKVSTNEVMKDVKIKLVLNEQVSKATGFKQRELICRLVKESSLRHTDIDGIWGINASSFKFID